MVFTSIFWTLFFMPGYALVRRSGRLPTEAGLLYTLAFAFAASLLLLSPVSLLCYALNAPLWVFSAAVVVSIGVSVVVLVRERAWRDVRDLLRRESPLPYLLLLGLLWLQARTGGWLDGDATFHLGRIRVLIEHGFTNRDIYLADPHFQHVYHSNLLFPVYASLARLTGQNYLDAWVYTEPWAKLLVAAGHYVLAYALTGRRLAGYLAALCTITANAGETYTLYPNTLCVGFLLPLLLGVGLRCLSGRALTLQQPLQIAALAWLLAQIHGLYAVYAALLLAPVLLLGLLVLRGRRERAYLLAAVAGLGAALPFLLVSMFAHQDGTPLTAAATPELDEARIAPAPPAGLASAAVPSQVEPPALAAGGGHLEKVMESPADGKAVFKPERMGGRTFVMLGFAGLCLALLLLPRGQRGPLVGAFVCALALALTLFTVQGATAAWRLLQTPFVVARLSTVLASLLIVGGVTCVALLVERIAPAARRFIEPVVMLLLLAAATQLLGQAPVTFAEHVRAALEPRATRRAQLEQLKQRALLLERTVPSGARVLTTARFARQVVMLRDCYVLAADRGHTHVSGIDKRRRDLVFLNAANTPWEVRQRLIGHYDLKWVTFENRWRQRYRWAYEHGNVVGSEAGQDVIELRR